MEEELEENTVTSHNTTGEEEDGITPKVTVSEEHGNEVVDTGLGEQEEDDNLSATPSELELAELEAQLEERGKDAGEETFDKVSNPDNATVELEKEMSPQAAGCALNVDQTENEVMDTHMDEREEADRSNDVLPATPSTEVKAQPHEPVKENNKEQSEKMSNPENTAEEMEG